MFPNLENFVDEMLRPRPKPTGWQKFHRFVRNDLLPIAIASFLGVMAVVGMIATGSYFINWLFA